MRFWTFFTLLLFACAANGYKILLITTITGKSHWLFLQHIIRALSERQHEVTCVTPFAWSNPKPANYTEILVHPEMDISHLLPQSKVYEAEEESGLMGLMLLPFIGYAVADYSLNTTNVQELIHSKNLHFDVVINEEFYQDSVSMFAHRFNAPLISISTYGFSDFFDRQKGLLTPWSHVPHTILTYSDKMSFTQRWHNTILSVSDWIIRRFVHIRWQTQLAEKYFGHLGPLPSIDDVNKNVSLMLVNSHRSVLPPRPMMPGVVLIGGAHIKPPKPLPADLKKFLDDAKNGAIYFSFGTYVRSSEMPDEKLKVVLNAMKRLKQRVLWKYDDESLKNIPSNVMIQKWLPQNDILAHPNVVLFISHGGMFGHLESLYRGVPLIMIPFFGDQFRNAIRAQNSGYAKHMKFNEITEETLVETITEMTTNSSYSQKANEISATFKHNLVEPLDEAVWWIEYVCRFKGAKHLKSHAVNMSWFSYLLIDVILATFITMFTILFSLYKTVKYLCASKKTEQDKKRKTQ